MIPVKEIPQNSYVQYFNTLPVIKGFYHISQESDKYLTDSFFFSFSADRAKLFNPLYFSNIQIVFLYCVEKYISTLKLCQSEGQMLQNEQPYIFPHSASPHVIVMNQFRG